MSSPINIEKWRLIDGYDNYEISSHGRVRNNKTNKIMQLINTSKGYLQIFLYKGGKRKMFRIHCLVGFAFLEKKEKDIEVDHIDHNRSNNMVDNLRWTTRSGNQRNASKRKDNTSGNQGVSFDKKGSGYWVANWVEEKRKKKSFSVHEYGEELAKELAIDYRKQMAEANGYLNV